MIAGRNTAEAAPAGLLALGRNLRGRGLGTRMGSPPLDSVHHQLWTSTLTDPTVYGADGHPETPYTLEEALVAFQAVVGRRP